MLLIKTGEIAKLGVLPSSLNNYWEYCDSFTKDESICQYETIIKASAEPRDNEDGGTFYEMSFERGKRLPDDETMDLVVTSIEEVNEAQKQVDEFYAQKSREYDTDSPVEIPPTQDDIPVINEGEEVNAELDTPSEPEL